VPHPLVSQPRFTRREWIRGLKPVTAKEAARRFGPINPIAWMIGHLAWQEQLYWLERAQSTTAVPEVKRFGFHLGESQAIRQLLGHTKLPTFVGGFGTSPYRPEPARASGAAPRRKR
jgi:hypothetical protein